MSHIRIVMTGHGRGEVFVDGQQVQDVQSIQFAADARNCANEVVLTVTPKTLDIDAPAILATRDSRLTSLLERIADDPGTRLAPDVAYDLKRFRIRGNNEKQQNLSEPKTWVCGCHYVRPLWADSPCPGCGQAP